MRLIRHTEYSIYLFAFVNLNNPINFIEIWLRNIRTGGSPLIRPYSGNNFGWTGPVGRVEMFSETRRSIVGFRCVPRQAQVRLGNRLYPTYNSGRQNGRTHRSAPTGNNFTDRSVGRVEMFSETRRCIVGFRCVPRHPSTGSGYGSEPALSDLRLYVILNEVTPALHACTVRISL